jgi:L-fuculose-phosphate aldolase
MRSDYSELISICHKVYNKGYVSASDGNLSVRTSQDTVIITRSGICKGEVQKEDLIEIDYNGNIISGSGRISTENKIHLYIYSKREDVKAVVHAHPVYTTAFAAARDTYPLNIFPEVILTLGDIPVCGYGTPSTDQVPESLAPHIYKGWAYILKNHGAVTLGKSIGDAFYKMEKLEHTSKILTAASLLGGANSIPEAKVEELLSISEKVYGIKINKD